MLKLESKKNEVYQVKENGKKFVVKIFSDEQKYKTELFILDTLTGMNLKILKRAKLNFDEKMIGLGKENALVYQWIEGKTLLECIEEVECLQLGGRKQEAWYIDEMLNCLSSWYEAMRHATGENWIVGDIHLRNFLYNQEEKTVYLIDYEECRKGRIEEDLGRLAAHMVTYDSNYPKEKAWQAEYLINKAVSSLGADFAFVEEEKDKSMTEINRRREAKNLEKSAKGMKG